MKYSSIVGNSQKLDGGAMFGNVPKAVWSKWLIPDEFNRISLSCRALLIQDEGKIILMETGIGAFFNPSLRDRYGVVESEHVLLKSLNDVGISENDIDIIILSHLHFDHAGGLLSEWSDVEPQKLLFPNAKYLVSAKGWERAIKPHPRDKASFIPHLNTLLEQSGRLILIDKESCSLLGKKYRFLITNGHTPGLMHTIIDNNEDSIIFASDLIPGTHWIHLPITMGYDRAPELVIDEKREMLELALKKNAQVFYTHDSTIAISRIYQDTSGRFYPSDVTSDFKDLVLG
ncbi:MAG: MBL fold metallo-hydrolase [Gammaproteobacteria bacterium]